MNIKVIGSYLIVSMFLFTILTGMVVSSIAGNLTDQLELEPHDDNTSIVRTESNNRAWGDDVKIGGIDSTNIIHDQLNPMVISDKKQYIYSVWEDDRAGDWNIYFTKTANSGAVWTTNISLSNFTTSQGNQHNPSIVYQPNNVSNLFVVWQDERNDDGDLYFTYSLDHGDTWVNESLINPMGVEGSNQWYPAIAVDRNSNIFVVWSDDRLGNWDIRFSKSSDFGATWSKSIIINQGSTETANQIKPDIKINSKDHIFITWEDDRESNKQIFLSKSIDSGKTFSNEIQVSSTLEFTDAKKVDMFIDEYDNILISWLEDFNSRYNLYVSISLDNGLSFSKPTQINDLNDSCHPDSKPAVISDTNGNIYVAWSDKRAKNHIYLALSLDNGKSYSIIEKVDNANNQSATGKSETTQEELWRGQVQLIQLQSKLFTFWVDYRNDPDPDDTIPYNGDIYYDWNFTAPNLGPEKPKFNEARIKKEWWYINLSWHASIDLDFAQYELYKSTNKTFAPDLKTLNVTITDRNQNYHNITNLSAGKKYYFRLKVFDYSGNSNISNKLLVNTKTNIAPTIKVLEPDGSINDLVDSEFTVVWEDNDPDDNATIQLFYDNNQNPLDGYKLISTVPYGEDSVKDFYSWDTRKIKNGSYYVAAVISDPVNDEQFPTYSPGKLIIYHGPLDPWLTISFKSPINKTDVDLDDQIIIIFNKKINMDTVHQDSFYVTDSNNTKVEGKYKFTSSNNKLTFTPLNQWNGSARYQVYLTTTIFDSTGLFRLDHDYNWWFETVPEPIFNGTISGFVLESDSEEPISKATIKLKDVNEPSNIWLEKTNSNGEFLFLVRYGYYELSIEKESYQVFKKIRFNLSQPFLELQQSELVRPVITDFNINGKISVDEKLKVSAIATHPNNEQLTYYWDFGDGTNESGQNLTHKYKKTGTYQVILTVTDPHGGFVTLSGEVEVEPSQAGITDLLVMLGIALLILIIGLIIIYLVLHRARERNKERLQELREEELDDEYGRVPGEEFEEEEEEEEEEDLEDEELEEREELEDLDEDEEIEDEDLGEDEELDELDLEEELEDEELEEQLEEELEESEDEPPEALEEEAEFETEEELITMTGVDEEELSTERDDLEGKRKKKIKTPVSEKPKIKKKKVAEHKKEKKSVKKPKKDFKEHKVKIKHKKSEIVKKKTKKSKIKKVD